MSGITDSSDKFSIAPKNTEPIKPHSKEVKNNAKEKLDLTQQGVHEVRSGSPQKVPKNITSPAKKEDVLEVNPMIDNVGNNIKSKKSVQKRNYNSSLLVKSEITSFKVFDTTNKLMKAISVSDVSEKQKISKILASFDPGEHSFQYGDHIIYVYKPKNENESLSLGVVNLAAVKAFAKGGFGKVYEVQMIDSVELLVLKLSRKKLKSKDRFGHLIPLTPDEKILIAAKGSSRGAVAEKDVVKEYQMMRFIKNNASSTVGLNCHAYSIFKYKNQSGLFIKYFDFDGAKFLKHNPSPQSRYHALFQICSGFAVMKELGIFHRDIKLENTLFNIIPGQKQFLCEAVVSDFGASCFLNGLFVNNPYPTFSDVLGNGTKRSTSFQIVSDLQTWVEELNQHKEGSTGYEEAKQEIKNLLLINDDFSLGILLYRLLTDATPPFSSYMENNYLQFASGSTKEERQAVLDQMESEVYSVCVSLQDPEDTVKLVMDCLRDGLDVNWVQ